MAKITCVPRSEANKLKEGVRKGEFDIAKMYEMTSAERRAIFEKYLGGDMARFVNSQFEKAMVSSRQTALKEWAEKTFKGKEVAQKKGVVERVNELQDAGLLDPQKQNEFMEDLIAEKLGVVVTPEEIKEITKYTDKLANLSEKLDGLQKSPVENVNDWAEYFKIRDDLNKYINSLTPNSIPAVASSIIGRSFLLTSIKSPVVNITANNVMAAIGGLTRRIESIAVKHPQLKGYNADYAKDYVKTVWKIWQKSNHDISRMTSATDDIKIRGESIVHAEGKGLTRKFARVMTDIVFKHAMGDYDVFSSAVNFADSAMLNSSTIAKQEGLVKEEAAERAKEIFQDATLINPKTLEGQQVRERARNDAEYFTFTNKAALSSFSLRARDLLNKLPGLEQLRIGDAQIPFAKVPANAISAAIDASGVTTPWHLYSLVKGIKSGNKALVDKSLRHLYLIGLGVLGSWLLSKTLGVDDYVGDYESYSPSERRLIDLKNGRYRSIRIGNKWISLDYFGPLMAPMVGFLEASRGQNGWEKSQKYVLGVVRQALSIPGMQELNSAFSGIAGAQKKSFPEIASEVKDGFVDFLVSRFIPAIISDTAEALDKSQRLAQGTVAQIKKKIPGMRETLPVKLNIFGKEIKTENPFSTLFFGSRVKTYEDNQVVNELNRLGSQGELPSISDVTYTSTRVKALAEQIGEDKFNKFIKYFGQEFYYSLNQEFGKQSYRDLTDEEKKSRIDKIRSDLLDKALRIYGYKKPRTK